MDMLKFEAILHKIQVDREGEYKLVLVISKQYKNQVINIPKEKRLAVGITEFEQ